MMNDHDTESQRALTENCQDNETPSNTSASGVQYFPVSEDKLMALYILSFGLYGIYWFYKNWKLQQPRMDRKIQPLMRAVFSVFFTHSLFSRIDKRTQHLERKYRFNANLLATFFVGMVIIGYLLDILSTETSILKHLSVTTLSIISLIIFLLSTYPLVAVQATINRLNNDMLGYLNHRYSFWNYLLIICGGIMWILLLLGLLAEAMGLTASEPTF